MIQACKHCKVEFENYRTRNFCGNECYHASKKASRPDMVLVCGWCKKEHIVPYRMRKLIYCSKACSNSATKRSRESMKCVICLKEFDVIKFRGDKAKYCSRECFDLKMRDGNQGTVSLKCENCGRIFSKKYIHRKRTFCSKSCAKSGENNVMTRPEVAAKVSAAISLSFIEGRRNFQKGYKSGYFESAKSNRRMYYRSSYELRALQILEADPAVVSFDTEALRIPYITPDGTSHYYIPDIIVLDSVGRMKLVEIKPAYQADDVSVVTKRKVASDYCAQRNLLYETWDEERLSVV